MNIELPHDQKINHGLSQIEQYRGDALPTDYDITAVLGDVLMCEYVDMVGENLVRNGIILPEGVADQKAWRIAKVILAGAGATQVKVGDTVLFPGNKGIPGIKKDGKQIIFLNEERVFCICQKSA